MIVRVVNETKTTINDAARQFAHTLPPERHADSQEALRFARWFGENRVAAELKPSDLEAYVVTFGASSPLATTRADSLKIFLGWAHKQKILPERYVSHVRVRRPTTRARPGTPQPEQRIEVRMTAEGKAALEAELDELKAHRPKIALELRDAMADKDFRENAPLDAAREAQGQLEARIRELEGTLRHAVLVEHDHQAADSARVGAKVIITNLGTGQDLSYQLVNAAEARAGTGRMSVESPVGMALVGHRVGDEVSVAVPSGTVRFKIKAIET
jgi:transcription elongation factor GreA